ncbi:MAG: gas vesicle protein GvpG [Deltaproteobacteria bacterium]|nr:gas vesicle protein GvpG [Deltaproteobacteria bacterium]
MFIVDDILMAPMKGFVWICEQIQEAAEQEQANEAENITIELQKLYRSLESGSITEEEFEARESKLLDRLDSIEGTDPDDDDEEKGTVIQVMGDDDEDEHEQEGEEEHSTKAILGGE